MSRIMEALKAYNDYIKALKPFESIKFSKLLISFGRHGIIKYSPVFDKIYISNGYQDCQSINIIEFTSSEARMLMKALHELLDEESSESADDSLSGAQRIKYYLNKKYKGVQR